MATKEQDLAMLIDSIGSKVKRKLTCSETLCSMQFRDLQIVDFIADSKKTMGEIAEEFNLTPGTITPLIDKLIEKEYLQRERDESIDRRKVFVSLSKNGKEAYSLHKSAKLRVAKAMLKGVSNEEKTNIINTMIKINENLEND